jgi:Fe-S cluster assembly protein SufD
VFVTHDAERCESRQVFKKVLRNGAAGVFQGKILVKPGRAEDRRLPDQPGAAAGRDSQFLAKPELEIYADDVPARTAPPRGDRRGRRCSTCARAGCRRAEATDLLVLAFLAEAIEEIEDEASGRYPHPAGAVAGTAARLSA